MLLSVTVPDGLGPGDEMLVDHQGIAFPVVLPAGCFPGSIIEVRAPVFPVNSMYDAWTLPNEYGMACPVMVTPPPPNPYPCSTTFWLNSGYCMCKNVAKDAAALTPAADRAEETGRARAFVDLVSASLDLSKDGAFLHSCFSHELAAAIGWSGNDSLKLIGGANLVRSIGDWFFERAGRSRGSSHFHVDCFWSEEAPHDCNPACQRY